MDVRSFIMDFHSFIIGCRSWCKSWAFFTKNCKWQMYENKIRHNLSYVAGGSAPLVQAVGSTLLCSSSHAICISRWLHAAPILTAMTICESRRLVSASGCTWLVSASGCTWRVVFSRRTHVASFRQWLHVASYLKPVVDFTRW